MSHRPGVTAARAGAALCVVAVALAGCGSGSHAQGTQSTASTTATSSASDTQAATPIAQAALRSARAPGERIAYTLKENSASTGPVTVTGTGAFNNSPATGSLVANIGATSASSSTGSGGLGAIGAVLSGQTLRLLVAKNVVYLKVPSSIASLISTYTQNKPYLSLNLAQLAANPQTAGLASIFGGQGGLTNPVQSLENLQSAGADSVTRVGPATLHGVATTEYRAVVQVAKLEQLVQSRGAAAKQALAQLKATGVSNVPYDVYIDSAGLVRRVSFSLTANVDGVQAPLAVQTDFLSYGKQPIPAAPSASQAADLGSLLSQLGG